MIKISMQEDLLVKELEVLRNMKGWLWQLLRTSKEKEVRRCTKNIPLLPASLVDIEPFTLSLTVLKGVCEDKMEERGALYIALSTLEKV